MKEKLRGIVLGTVKHSDKNNIVTIYTAEYGRMAFISKCGSGTKRHSQNALLMPLSIIEINTSIHKNKDLQLLGQITPLAVYRDIYFNPIKNCIGIFIADFLNRVLRDTPPDSLMWKYIADSLLYFDFTKTGIANFHIAFIFSLSSFLGIQPDTTGWQEGSIFDMQAGRYTTLSPVHSNTICGEEAKMLLKLSRMNYANSHLFRFNQEIRNRIIDHILHYYELHIPGVAGMKSTEILRSLFDLSTQNI